MAQPGLGGFHGGVFATMKFPKYKFVEYPKRITLPTGERVRVMDQADELRVKARIPEERPQTEVERERNAVVAERDDLAAQIAARDDELAKLRDEVAKLQVSAPKGAPSGASGPSLPIAPVKKSG